MTTPEWWPPISRLNLELQPTKITCLYIHICSFFLMKEITAVSWNLKHNWSLLNFTAVSCNRSHVLVTASFLNACGRNKNQAIKDSTVPTIVYKTFFGTLKLWKKAWQFLLSLYIYVHSTNSYEMLQKHSD